MANNYNEQFPRLIHMPRSNHDPNDQAYDCDDLQDEPHFSMPADFGTNNSSLNNSQFMRNDTQ